MGARRVVVTGTGPLGCAPAEIAMRSTNGHCATELMRATDLFNPQLVQVLKELNSQFGSDVFISANSNRMHFDFVANPRAYGNKISATFLIYHFYLLSLLLCQLILKYHNSICYYLLAYI